MHDRTPALSDADIERLLRDCGSALDVPDAPDLRVAIRVRLTASPVRSGSLENGDDEAIAATFPVDSSPEDLPLPERRDRRWWLIEGGKFAGATAAIILVAIVLVLAFRGNGDDASHAGGGDLQPAREVLFVVSGELGLNQLTAFSTDGLTELYRIDLTGSPDAVLSPDGTRLYVADFDELIAYDAATGEEIWRTEIKYRVRYILGMGPSILGVSPDGSRVFVHSYDSYGDFGDYGGDAANIPHWVHVVDAETGEAILDTEKIPGYCNAEIHSLPESGTILQICFGASLPQVRAFDPQTGERVDAPELEARAERGAVIELSDGGGLYLAAKQAALSPDNQRLFVAVGSQRQESGQLGTDLIRIYDTDTWEVVRDIHSEVAITGQSLAVDASGNIYASTTRFVDGTSIPAASDILIINPEDASIVTRTLAGEEILRLFIGRVPVE